MQSLSYGCFSTGMHDERVIRIDNVAGRAIRPLSTMQRIGYNFK